MSKDQCQQLLSCSWKTQRRYSTCATTLVRIFNFSYMSFSLSRSCAFVATPSNLWSKCDIYLDLGTNKLSSTLTNSFFQTCQLSKLVACLCAMLRRKLTHLHHHSGTFAFQAYFSSHLFFFLKGGTLMSLKSHYSWGSAPVKNDFLWFCSGGKKMREAKSPWSKIQMDVVTRGMLWITQHLLVICLAVWRYTTPSQDVLFESSAASFNPAPFSVTHTMSIKATNHQLQYLEVESSDTTCLLFITLLLTDWTNIF